MYFITFSEHPKNFVEKLYTSYFCLIINAAESSQNNFYKIEDKILNFKI